MDTHTGIETCGDGKFCKTLYNMEFSYVFYIEHP